MRNICLIIVLFLLTSCDNFYRHLVLRESIQNHKKVKVYSDQGNYIFLKAAFSQDRYNLDNRADEINLEVISNIKMESFNLTNGAPKISLIRGKNDNLDLKVHRNTKERLGFWAIIPEGTNVNYDDITVMIKLQSIVLQKDTLSFDPVIFRYKE